MQPGAEVGILHAMHPVHVFQILNHYTSRQDLDPGFDVLDNSANERPDWYEYWPIRNFLHNAALDEHAFYGFLSPKFRLKTNLASADVHRFLRESDPATEVALFSPSIHNSAYFLNVFEHGDAEHPGLLDTAQRLFERLGYRQDLRELVSDSRNTVHSNYFIAKPRFWRAWLAFNERLFAIAEDASDPLGRELSTPTRYRGRRDVHLKIFIMERVATWLLLEDPSFRVRVRDPFVAQSRLYKLPTALVCDALKIAYATQGRRQYKDVFLLVSAMRKFLNMQIRLGGPLGGSQVRRCLEALRAPWSGPR